MGEANLWRITVRKLKPRFPFVVALLAIGIVSIAMDCVAQEIVAEANSVAADFYLSPLGDDTWSGGLPAPNADRTDGPTDPEVSTGADNKPPTPIGPLKAIVKQHTVTLEKDLIRRALEETAGNVTKAARKLEISRKSLQNKMKELGLRDPTPEDADAADTRPPERI